MKKFILLGIVIFSFGASATNQTIEDLVKTHDEIVFQPAPEFEGLEVALIAGNPNAPGPYVLRAKFAAGILSKPHSHDQIRHITVLKGIWHFGLGPSGSCDGTKPINAGGTALHPKGVVHYDGACGSETIVEITGIGPVKTTFVKPAQ
ncbi:cupin domain-containing protein [Kordiimonas aquimaris]|uniref:cupin domain-containing protein n=1 Tax=Kordiimonas aquimaris TaxID=707591 RepID=UPI0021CE656E|nr:cupin domain-containing protein [Kordiimonas aquimaris]